MALSAEAARLTEAHQASQTRRAAVIALLVQRLFQRTVNPADPGTAVRWIDLVLPQIIAASNTSAGLARAYYTAFRILEGPGLEPFTPEPTIDLPVAEQIRTSLWVTGPKALDDKVAKIRRNADISPTLERAMIQDAITEAGDQAGGAAARHATEGGRAQIKDSVAEDRVALGWLRVTKTNPCYFCAMMASRGPVYQDDSFDDSNELFRGDGPAKAHDHCVCSLQPVYSRKDPGLDRANEWETLWINSTKGKSGSAAVNAFRQAYEGR